MSSRPEKEKFRNLTENLKKTKPFVLIHDFLSITGSSVYGTDDPDDLDIVVRAESGGEGIVLKLDRNLMMKVQRVFEEHSDKKVHFIPASVGPNWDHVPAADLVVVPKDEFEYRKVQDTDIIRKKSADPLEEAETSKRKDRIAAGKFFYPMKPARAAEVKERMSVENLADFVGDYPAYVEKKYDGVHCILMKASGEVRIVTDDGTECTERFPELSKSLKNLRGDNKPSTLTLAAEIEVWKGDEHLDREDVAGYIHSHSEPDESGVVANVFDILFEDGKDLHKVNFIDRRGRLEKYNFPQSTLGKPESGLNLVSSKKVLDDEELVRVAKELSHKQGSEGVVVKTAGGEYHIDGLRSYSSFVKFHKNILIHGIVTERKETKTDGVFNYRYAIKSPNPATPVEVGGETYEDVGYTFSTKVKANVGDIIEVEAETVNVEDKDGQVDVTAWVPRFIGVSERKEADTVDAVIDAAEDEGILSIQDQKSDGDWPDGGDKEYNYVVQHHYRGKSVHGDLRIEHNDYLIGWTLMDQQEGEIDEPVTAMSQAVSEDADPDSFKINWKTGEFDKRQTRSGSIQRANIRCAPKKKEPSEWLKVEGVSPAGEVGATKEYPGVFHIVDEGKMAYGAQKPYFHEYFFDGKALEGRIIFRQISRKASKWTNSPTLAYTTVYGEEPDEMLRGRTEHGERDWNGLRVDEHLKDEWLDALSEIDLIEVRASCEGHGEDRPTYIVIRLNDDGLSESVAKSLHTPDNGYYARCDMGAENRPRICIAGKTWYGESDWKDWWDGLAGYISQSLSNAEKLSLEQFNVEGIDYDLAHPETRWPELLADLRYLGNSGYPKLSAGEEWGEWDMEALLKYFAKIVDVLRSVYFPLLPPSKDDESFDTSYWKAYRKAEQYMESSPPKEDEISGWNEQRESTIKSNKAEVLPPSDEEETPRSAFYWIMMKPKEQTPYVLQSGEKDWIPPKDFSCLPTNVKKNIPEKYQYWKFDDESKRKSVRDELIKEFEVHELGVPEEEEKKQAPELPPSSSYVEPMSSPDWRETIKNNLSASLFVLADDSVPLVELRRYIRKAEGNWLIKSKSSKIEDVFEDSNIVFDGEYYYAYRFKSESKYRLVRRWWRGQYVVRFGPSTEIYDLLVKDGGKTYHFEMDGDPREENVMAVPSEEGTDKLWSISDSSELDAGTALNPTKETPAWADVVAEGGVKILEDSASVKKFDLEGEKTIVIAREESGSNIWTAAYSEDSPNVKLGFKMMTKNEDLQIVGGVVYQADRFDTDGEKANSTVIRDAMYYFMEHGLKFSTDHDKFFRATVLECFQAEEDTQKAGGIVKAGDWYMTIRINDPNVWVLVKNEEIRGFSWEGRVMRRKIES
jgi:hypothetical protein